MLILPCPWCGPRNVDEFGYSGEVVSRPEPAATREEWRGYLYLRANPADWTTERWFHRMGCRRYFTVRRHRTTGEVAEAGQIEAGQIEAGQIEAGQIEAGQIEAGQIEAGP